MRVLATWQDVLNKAKRLVDEGRVSISYVTGDLIGGTCEGDNGHYEPILAFDEDNMKISDSTCNCFVPGMLVTMADGTMKPIEEVSVGDVVITHLDNAKPVLKEFKREYVGEVIVVGLGGNNIYCTPEHPFYIAEDEELKWVKASDLKVGTLLTHPTDDGYDYFAISELDKSGYEGFVYNIEVADDNSYVVNNVNVHNCAWGAWQWERMPGPKVNNPRGLGGYGGLRGRKCAHETALYNLFMSVYQGGFEKQKVGMDTFEIADKIARAADEDCVVILDNEDCRGLTLVGADFVGGSFVDTIFMDCDLSESDFSMSECFYTNFRGSNLSFVNFNDASLIGVDFTDCDLTGASFVGAFISEDSVIDEDELWRFEDCVYI